MAVVCSVMVSIVCGGVHAASADPISGESPSDADGSVGYVEVDAGVMSLGQCPSSRFCVWGLPNYTGSFRSYSGTNVTHSVGAPVGSFWNDRSQAATLYINTGAYRLATPPG